MNNNLSQQPGIYIHIPFCRHKCGYCDFYSVTNLSVREDFIRALCKEIEISAGRFITSQSFDTVYLGGGTPSLLGEEETERIFASLRKHFRFADDCEITVEVNPGTITPQKLQHYKQVGVNRLSIGVQSFRQNELQLLERIHSVEEAGTAVAMAREAGFDNIGIDLIYALPGQTRQGWEYTLQQAVALQPQHISAYNLTFEEGTPFYRRMQKGELLKMNEEEEKIFFQQTESFLGRAGYLHYEVSNYAVNRDFVSRHNYKYWLHAPYLGFGPSAHSFWQNERHANVRSLDSYLNTLEKNELPLAFTEQIDREKRRFENIFLQLRTYEGIRLQNFENEFELSFTEAYKKQIDHLLHAGLAELNDEHFRLTSKGMMVCDAILPQFITY